MPENNDYRDLINEKFKSLDTKLELHYTSLHEMMSKVEIQTSKTNGKVLDLQDRMNKLEKSDLSHQINCPKTKEFIHLEDSIEKLKNSVDDRLKDVSFYVRNPKLGLAIIVIAVIVTLFSYFEITTLIESNTKSKIEATK